jgi:hypothetical protein
MVGEWAKGEMKNEKSRVLRYSATVLQFEIGVFKVIRKFYIYIYRYKEYFWYSLVRKVTVAL